MSPAFFIVTLGCKINQYESRSLREAWLSRGWSEALGASDADTVIVNTCAVTEGAVRDVRAAVRRAYRENPAAEIIIAGCAVEAGAEELGKLPGVSRLVGQEEKKALLPDGRADAPLSISGYDRARAVLKVQDGCSHNCAYCIVPKTRGKSVSREPGEIVAEAGRLLAAGFRELTISGVNLRHYGRGLAGDRDFWKLIRLLEEELAPKWAGRARLRLSSLDPAQLGAEALDVLRGSELLCPHLHLSLQSLSDPVLLRMRRGHYNFSHVAGFVEQLQTVWPVFALGADFICGHPGESEADFETTLARARELPLTYAHVFPYSERPGTAAATMDAGVDPALRKRRAKRLREMVGRKRSRFVERLAGLDEVEVIVERTDPARGRCQYYVECFFDSDPGAQPRQLVRARPAGIEKGRLLVRAGAEE